MKIYIESKFIYLNVWLLPKFYPNISQFQTGVTDVGVLSSSLEAMVMLWPEGLKGRISPSPAPIQGQLGFSVLCGTSVESQSPVLSFSKAMESSLSWIETSLSTVFSQHRPIRAAIVPPPAMTTFCVYLTKDAGKEQELGRHR